MDKLQAMRVFTAVVEAGSFSRAAQQMHLSLTAASRHIAALEKQLNARLLQRSTRRMHLTETGTHYYERCRAILADIDEAEAEASSAESQPKGTLRVSLPHSFGLRYIAPLIPEFCKRYPDLQLELRFSDRHIDLLEEGIDMAIRITDEPATHLIARRLAPVSMVCCASPGYLARHGTPQAPADLASHACITYLYSPHADLWVFKRHDKTEAIHVKGPLRANSGDMGRLAAMDSLGITILPSFIVCNDLRLGHLRPILGDYTIPQKNVYAVYLPGARRSGRVRAMVDYLWDSLGKGTPSWESCPMMPPQA